MGLIASYDIDWQKISTGNLFDSLSGHAFIIGARTGNIIGFRVKSKSCSKCKTANVFDQAPDDHECQINWERASGAMEAAVALEICIDLYDGDYAIFIKKIVSDDDSTLRSHLVHEEQGGKLPLRIPPPEFLADPSHRIKVMSGPIFSLAKSEGKNPAKCKKIDTLRIKNTLVFISTKIRSNQLR